MMENPLTKNGLSLLFPTPEDIDISNSLVYFDLNLPNDRLEVLITELKKFLGSELSRQLHYGTYSNYYNSVMFNADLEDLPDAEEFISKTNHLTKKSDGSALPALLVYLSKNIKAPASIIIFSGPIFDESINRRIDKLKEKGVQVKIVKIGK